jgi:hypothetical protein
MLSAVTDCGEYVDDLIQGSRAESLSQTVGGNARRGLRLGIVYCAS